MKNLMGGAGFWIVEGILWAYCILTAGSQRVLQESAALKDSQIKSKMEKLVKKTHLKNFCTTSFNPGRRQYFTVRGSSGATGLDFLQLKPARPRLRDSSGKWRSKRTIMMDAWILHRQLARCFEKSVTTTFGLKVLVCS